jgi:ParB-like chromosome segregation protein Spo0J
MSTEENSPITIHAEAVELIPLGELRKYPRNARTHSDDQVIMLAKLFREFGFTQPILIDENNLILAGHGRLAAAELSGMPRVPSVRIVGLSEAQKRAYILADNRSAEKAGWDRDLLKLEIGELRLDADFDMDLTGFTTKDIMRLESTGSGDGDGLKYKIIVDCENETAQAALMDTLEKQGFSVRALTE